VWEWDFGVWRELPYLEPNSVLQDNKIPVLNEPSQWERMERENEGDFIYIMYGRWISQGVAA